jgi:hypothetical protein
MPRKRVTTSYTQARTTPSKRLAPRQSVQTEMKSPTGLTPMAKYIEENLDTGIPVTELIEQFQEYDCEHKHVTNLAVTAEKITTRCDDCGKMEMKFRPGVKDA